jgi:phage tail protein X
MADLGDVTAALLALATTAVYPSGNAGPSVTSTPVRLFEGWPLADQLDLDMAGNMKVPGGGVTPNGVGPISNVSVFPMAGAGGNPYQVLDYPSVIVPPVYGLTASISSNVLTLTGTPTAGEYLTIIAQNSHVYSRTGASAAAILSALQADAVSDYPSVTATSSTITFPTTSTLQARLGAPGTMGQVTHRQKHAIIVSVWAPTPALRNALAAAIDVVMKENIRITLPDTSEALITYDRAIQSDNFETATVYRRDLYYNVEYATLQQFQAYVVTSVTTQWQPVEDYTGTAIGPPATSIQ